MSRNYKFQNGYSILNISRNQVSKATRKDSRGSGDKFNIDLINNPQLALESKLAVKILVYGSEAGAFTSLKLEDFINSKKKDYYNARKIINGLDKVTKIENYAIAFEKCIKLD